MAGLGAYDGCVAILGIGIAIIAIRRAALISADGI
jgi:hypothetical protein